MTRLAAAAIVAAALAGCALSPEDRAALREMSAQVGGAVAASQPDRPPEINCTTTTNGPIARTNCR
ncbi:MAG TPA: hypothetical protein VFB45_15515 [Pseudolabrys sp.]|nr:hypothetical protein [Pseudolabrys sp.]